MGETQHQTSSVDFDAEAIRRDFPIFEVRPHGKPLIYLDNAATSQKPNAVIETIRRYISSLADAVRSVTAS